MTTSAARVSVIYYSATGNVHGLAHAFTDRQRSPESRPCTHVAEPCLRRQAPRETQTRTNRTGRCADKTSQAHRQAIVTKRRNPSKQAGFSPDL